MPNDNLVANTASPRLKPSARVGHQSDKVSPPMTSDPILIADDNAVDRMILAKIVRDQGYEVV